MAKRHALAAGIVALVMGLAGHAGAQETIAVGPPAAPDTPRMRRAMHAYFEGELNEAWAFGAAGIVTLGGGAALLAANDDLYRGAAFPLGVVGLIQLGAGIVLLAKTDGIVADLDRRLDRGRAAFLEVEQPRMEKVRGLFGVLEVTELALMIGGLGLAAYGGARDNHLLTGIGGGLGLQAAAMLAFDGAASTRAETYSAAIQTYAGR